MIDRYHSNVDWEVGEIICKVTQLCPHSLQPSEEGNVGVLAHVGWGSGFVFNHKDRPSMARPWTAMYEAFSLRLQGGKRIWVRKHLGRNSGVRDKCNWSYLSTSGMFIGSYGSSFCSMPGWLPATEAGSTVPSTCKNVKFVKHTRTSFGQTRITDQLCTTKHERSWEVCPKDHFLITGACAMLIQTYKISRNRTRQLRLVYAHSTALKSFLQRFNMVDYIIHNVTIF